MPRTFARLTVVITLVMVGLMCAPTPLLVRPAAAVPGCGPMAGLGSLSGRGGTAWTTAGVETLGALGARPSGAASNGTYDGCGWLPASIPHNLSVAGTALWAAAYYNAQVLVAVGSQGTVLRSTDGGQSWMSLQTPGAWTTLLRSVFMDDTGVLWVGGSGGFVMESLDAGLTWQNVSTPGLVGDITDLRFLDGANDAFGWAVSSSGLFVTHDRGHQWSSLATPVGGTLLSAAFYDPAHGWAEGYDATGVDHVFYTRNGGASWIEGNTAGWDPNSRSILPTSASSAWLLQSKESVLETTDGINWTGTLLQIDLETPHTPPSPGMAIIDGQFLWADMQDANIFYSSNGGGCWMEEAVPAIPVTYGMAFYSSLAGVILGTGSILYTQDGGVSPLDVPGTSSGVDCTSTPPSFLSPPLEVVPAVAAGLVAGAVIWRTSTRGRGAVFTSIGSKGESQARRRVSNRKRYRSRRRYVGG